MPPQAERSANETIVIIDDEPAVGALVARLLSEAGLQAEQLDSASMGLKRLAERPLPSAILVDLHMPDTDGLGFLEQARLVTTEVPVVVMTARASIETAVEAMKRGAFDFLTKPFEPLEVVSTTCLRAVAHARVLRQNRELKQQLHGSSPGGLVGSAPAMRKLRQLIEAVSPTDATVLVVGETGTGKELVARAVHEQSLRRLGPFVPVNCGALSENLLESELFGHVRGAFTGATSARRGLVEAASGGTLFLDEVAELSLGMQTRLLRVLQEGEIRPVGSDARRLVDVRVVAATHRDLKQAVAEGRFREDLYYRLNVFRIGVLPLRERREDIPALTRHFIDKLALRFGKKPPEITADAVTWLCEMPWPGNLRQLENTLERALILAPGRVTQELVETVADLESGAPGRVTEGDTNLPFNEARHHFERVYLSALLKAAGGGRAEAARRAGLDPSNLRRLLKRHRLD